MVNTDCVIDIETTGLKPYAGVVSIGLAFFNWDTLELGKSYQIQLFLCPENEIREYDDNTINWWMGKRVTDTARNQLVRYSNEDGYSLMEGLILLNKLIDKEVPKSCAVWGNGSIFDQIVLENAYEQCGIKVPWHFTKVNDCRTAVRTFKRMGIVVPKMKDLTGTAHVAKDDAEHERHVLVTGYKAIDDIVEQANIYKDLSNS